MELYNEVKITRCENRALKKIPMNFHPAFFKRRENYKVNISRKDQQSDGIPLQRFLTFTWILIFFYLNDPIIMIFFFKILPS